MDDASNGAAFRTALKPLEVVPYLRVRGWRQEAEIGDKGSIWVLPASGDREEADITLPPRRDLGDFALRMGDVCRVAVNDRTPDERNQWLRVAVKSGLSR
jgi:hypothetical protein